MSIYDMNVENGYGESVSLEEYKGKVLLIQNSATECGFTPQYDELQDIYEDYKKRGFEILDFPCNQFGSQAPGSNAEIASFCDAKFGITFRIFSKIDVNGENASPLFKYLKEQKGFEGFQPEHPLAAIIESMLEREKPNFRNEADIKWNFTKFLIDREGNVVARFEPTEDMSVIRKKIEELL